MAKVFMGKAIITKDQIDDYLQAMRKAEKEREPFRKMLEGFNQDFETYLSEMKAISTIDYEYP